ncbi:MAG: cellulase [bacterium]
MFDKLNLPVTVLVPFISICFFGMVSCQSWPQHKPDTNSRQKKLILPEDAVNRVEKYFTEKLNSRYMERNSEPTTYPGWEGYPLIKCKYTVKDNDGTIKPAEVIMLNATPHQLARWVVYTCIAVKTSSAPEYTDKLSHHIIYQSGAQFPVAGMVYEDMEGDGVFKLYCFRDGITVGIKGIANQYAKVLTPEQIQLTLYGEVEWSGKYARIQSTTREQYTAAGGKVDVGTSEKEKRKSTWLTVSRELYQKAWNNDRNELMFAWAKQNL